MSDLTVGLCYYLATGFLFATAFLLDLATGKATVPNGGKPLAMYARISWVVVLLIIGWPFAAINATADHWRRTR